MPGPTPGEPGLWEEYSTGIGPAIRDISSVWAADRPEGVFRIVRPDSARQILQETSVLRKVSPSRAAPSPRG